MAELAERLKDGEMTNSEIMKKYKLTKVELRTLIYEMTDVYPIYEEKYGKNTYIGILCREE